MNLVVLFVLKKLLHINTAFYKLELASAIGGIGACILVLGETIALPRILQFLFMYVIVSILMIWIAFPYRNIRTLCIQTVELYIVAFFISGLLSFLYYGIGLKDFISQQIKGEIFQHRTAMILIKGIIGIVLFLPFLCNIWKCTLKNSMLLYNIELRLGNKKIKGIGLLDTGNQLSDPIYGEPVCICEWAWAKELFTIEQKASIENYKQLNLEKEIIIPIVPIMFHSVGKENGMLIGIKVDELAVYIHHKKVTKYKSMIALYEGALTNDRRYQVILHQEIVEE